MVDSHSKIFFGQNTGLIVNSPSKYDPFIFIRCIKKKPNGHWEKSSENEGKMIKCSIEEIVMILQVLNRRSLNWQTFHTYKENKTSLAFSWEDESSETLWVNIGDYSKMLTLAQTEILRLLLSHLLKEKVIFSTSSKRKDQKRNDKEIMHQNFDNDINTGNHDGTNYLNFIEEMYEYPIVQKETTFLKNQSEKGMLKSKSNVDGMISGETDKAILISFDSDKEIWIPKSSIHCQYIPRKNLTQKFLIDNWILKKNKIIL